MASSCLLERQVEGLWQLSAPSRPVFRSARRACALFEHLLGSRDAGTGSTECGVQFLSFAFQGWLRVVRGHILVLRPNIREIPELMFCRILMFRWSFGPLVGYVIWEALWPKLFRGMRSKPLNLKP